MVTSDHWLCSPHSSYARFSASNLLLHRVEHAEAQGSGFRQQPSMLNVLQLP